MERIMLGRSLVLAEAIERLPPPLQQRVAIARFWTGDPLRAGLHKVTDTLDGRSYRSTPHTCYPWHTRDKSVVIVLPVEESVDTIIHELGHVAHFTLGLDDFGSEPVTEYATRNHREAFAEAFTTRFFWGYGDEEIAAKDSPTNRILDLIAAVPADSWKPA